MSLANPPMKKPFNEIEQDVPVLPQLGADPNTVKFSRGSRWRLSRDAELHVLNVLMPNEMHTTPHDAGKEPCFILCKRKKIPVPSLFGMLHACTLRAVKKSWHKYVEEAVTRHYGDLTDLTLYHLNVEALQKHIGSIALYCRGTTLIESYNWTEKVRVTITADFEECPPESEFEAAEVDPKWLLVRLTEFGSPHHVTDMYYSWDFFSNLNDANPALSNMENTQWVHESETDILTPVTEGDTWAHEMKHLPNASQLSTPGLIWLMARLVKPGTISEGGIKHATLDIAMLTKHDVRKLAKGEKWKLPSGSQFFRSPGNFLGAFDAPTPRV